MKETYKHLAADGQVRIQLSFGRTATGVPIRVGSNGVTLEVNGQEITRDEWELV